MKSRTVPGLILFLFSFLFSSAILTRAQQGAADTEPATLTANTELVLVAAQVKGSDGKPLLGLKQQDFVLRSDGKPLPIGIFEESLRTATKSTAQTKTAQPAPLNRTSNVPDSGMPDQILIIALDLVNTTFLDQNRAKQQLLKYLAAEKADRHFALVAITPHGLAQIHNFSSDPAVLLEALRRIETSTAKDVTMTPPLPSITAAGQFGTRLSPADEFNSMAVAFPKGQAYIAYTQKLQAKATLTALMQIAQAYAGVPGRKSVIWLTGGMPVLLYEAFAGGINNFSAMNGDAELTADYEQVFDAMNNANIAIYGVDVKGVKMSTGLSTAPRNLIYPSRMVKSGENNDDAIKVLSAATGGKACTANTELKDCIDEAVDDSNSYYQLGFYVPQQDRKPGWHKLKVELVSGRGSVRSRTKYYLASQTAPAEKEINRTLRDATAAKIDYTGIAFSVERQQATQSALATAPMMRIIVSAGSVLLTPGHPQLSYDIATVALNDSGDPATDLRVVHLNLSPEQTQSALNKGWAYFDPAPGTSTQAVKYVLRDNGTGRIGSLVVSPQKTAAGG